MDFNQLKSYIAVVEVRVLQRQQRRISALSLLSVVTLQKLEEELKVKLLVRTTKNINITKRGEEIYRHACDILRLQEMMLQGVAKEERVRSILGQLPRRRPIFCPSYFLAIAISIQILYLMY